MIGSATAGRIMPQRIGGHCCPPLIVPQLTAGRPQFDYFPANL